MKLFEAFEINGMKLKNRVVMPAMHMNFGVTSRRARGYYVERAKGGVGTIIMPALTPDAFIDEKAWEGIGSVAGFLARLRQLADEVRQHGARIGLQLWLGDMYPAGLWGGYGMGQNVITGDRVAPSVAEGKRALTRAEIETIIDDFARAAVRAREGGLDFVEIHGAHGYLVEKFFSPLFNRRTDEYGGSLENRMRFGLDCVRRTRQMVGRDYPVLFRVGAVEKPSGGVTLADSVEYAVELEKAGADLIDVSTGDPSPDFSPPDGPEGCFVPWAAAIKARARGPVMGVGLIHSAAAAEDCLQKGYLDLVGVGRQLIADPHWTRKVAEGREKDVNPCIVCNECLEAVMVRHTEASCPVNADLGQEG